MDIVQTTDFYPDTIQTGLLTAVVAIINLALFVAAVSTIFPISILNC